MIRVAILGARGRMGQELIKEISLAEGLTLIATVEREGHPDLGLDVHDGMLLTSDLAATRKADVLIDFSTPDTLDMNLRAALDTGAAMVIGTTGLQDRHHAAIDKAARIVPILQSANMSLGVTLMLSLVEKASRALGPDWDIEIVELHHRHKVDAPSGTALALGEAAARGRGAPLKDLRLPPHDGLEEERPRGGIGFASLRAGSAAGDHHVHLGTTSERIILSHEAESRNIFARGAVTATRWLMGRPADRYSMRDVLDI